MLSKPRRIRNEAYLKWIREKKCVICGSPYVEASHIGTGGMGTKVTDYFVLPMCAEHHRTGKYSYHRMNMGRFSDYYGVNLYKMIAEFLIQYIEEIK